jgi:hypothetical protein
VRYKVSLFVIENRGLKHLIDRDFFQILEADGMDMAITSANNWTKLDQWSKMITHQYDTTTTTTTTTSTTFTCRDIRRKVHEYPRWRFLTKCVMLLL